jgi:glycosyltransferase involved in cell wall biosynthesis
VHGPAVVDLPTSVGFCMYIRRECLLATGLLREDAFAQGYGEENDFCIRARHLGWRHVAVPGAYVAHVGGHSFGDARAHLMARNLDVLEALHPGYRAMIAGWQAADPLAPARRALDAARWADRLPPSATRRAVVLVTHDGGGGVERAVRARCDALRGEGIRPILLRPVVDRSLSPAAPRRRYLPGLCVLGDDAGGFPNLRFRLPEELGALTELLRAERPHWLEVHHLLGLHHCVLDLPAALRIPYEIHVHDYAWICPRINLVGPTNRYCGEPHVAACASCVADAGSELEEVITPAALRARSAADMAGARRVVAPSHDAANRLPRYFPHLRADVLPHEDDADLPPLRPLPEAPPTPLAPRRIGVIGAIGTAKGYEIVLGCARDAAARDLCLSFIVVGHTEDDERLLATGRVFVTGPYQEGDAVAVIRQQDLHLAWLPSVWPETWCYALGQALRAGLGAAAFDLGAQAERIRATRRGWLLPLGLSIPAINNRLLALRTVAGDEYARLPAPGESATNTQRFITARI